MYTPHINAKIGEFSDTVIISGDPLRSKYIAKNFLSNIREINNTRCMFGYTGEYKNKLVSVMSHGIGIPSSILYVTELSKYYKVKKIIRVGTCGSTSKNIKLRDIIIVTGASTDSMVNRIKFNNYDFSAVANFEMLNNIVRSSEMLNIKCKIGNIFSTDLFYNDSKHFLKLMNKYNILGVDMETSGIYSTAIEMGMKAISICTVSDIIGNVNIKIPSKDRVSSFNEMIKIALESITI
ncbi:purine-nucleoside phosphorylase [Buchnera aphidicola (Taiwanaphis decaspermi)]|uniref:purine-nucleoside phosphorylase n=1 Tax=Buchnera aphidicola TaxID=9 RepID=UPI0031B83444